MHNAVDVLAVALLLFLLGGFLLWAAGDANRRGKPALLVLVAVVFFFLSD